MNKIPVGRTIGQAYHFAFFNLATIIGIIWLPMGLMLAGEYALIRYYFLARGAAFASGNRFVLYGVTGDIYLFWFLFLLVQALVTVPVMRQALGLRNKGARIHFALGMAELRLFGGYVAYNVILFVLSALARIGWLLLAALLVWGANTYGGAYGLSGSIIDRWSAVLGAWIVVAVTVVAYVRLGFLLAPVVVAERRIDFIHNWRLTEGNFWRALAVVIAVTVPAWLLYLAVQMGFVGVAMYGDVFSAFQIAGRVAQSQSPISAQLSIVLAWLPYFFSAWFLLEPLVLGLTSGAAAAAYRSLVPEDMALPAGAAAAPLSPALP